MPTIDKVFLLKVFLSVLVLVGALVGVHTIQADRIPAAIKRQADRALEAGKTDAAVRYLRQYLEFNPDDVDVQTQLVELILKRNPTARGQVEALFLYDRILRLDPDRHAVRRDALTACLKLGRWSDALTHAEVLLKQFPKEAKLWHQFGAAQAGLNQLTEARQSYERALQIDPTDLVSYQRLAQLVWRNMSDPDGACEVLKRLVDGMPQDPDAHLIRARFETFLADEPGNGQPDFAMATAELQRVLELDPENADATLLLAEVLQRGRKVTAAHHLLKEGVALYPKDLRMVRSLSWLELVRGNAPAAIGVLEDGLKASPDAFDLLVPLADLLVQQGDTVRTAEILRQLEMKKAQPIQVKYLKARVAMRDGRWTEATELLQALRGESTHLPGLEIQLNQLLAVCAERLADFASEETAFQRAIQADPKNVQARVGLGNLYLTLGRFEDAAREMEIAALSPYASPNAIADWVRTRLQLLRAAKAPIDEWRRLEQQLAAVAAAFGPVSSEPVILQAQLNLAMGKGAEAVQLLRKEVSRRPGDGRLWAALAETTADVAGTPSGLGVVDEAQAAAGDTPDVRLVRARLYANEPGQVRLLAPLSEGIDSWPEAEQLRLLYGMVEVYDHQGDQVGLVAMLRRIAGLRPADPAIWLRLFERAIRIGDAQAIAESKNALTKLPGEARKLVVLCDAASAQPADARRIMDQLVAAFGQLPARSDACLALARLYRLTGNDPDEGRLIERAFMLEPTRFEAARVHLHLVCTGGDEQRVHALVGRLATDPRWAGEPFRRLVGSVVSTLARPVASRLITECKPHVEGEPGGLGWLAETAARYEVCPPLPLLEEATAQPIATADDWLRLAIHRGPSVMQAAKAKLTAAAFLAMAAVFRETPEGREYEPEALSPVEQRLFAQSRLALHLTRGKPEDGMKVLEKYLAGKALPETDVSWARRNLAMLYAVGGTPEDRKRAMELIEDVTDAGSSPDELRAMASVLTTLARYLEGSDRITVLKRAATALDAAYQAGKSPRDLFNLSQIHRNAGNRAEGRKCLQALLNADQKNIYYLVAALEEHMEDNNFVAGEAFAKKLLAEHGGEFRAVAAVARFECQAGRPMEALALAERYAQSADPAAGDHLTRAARVAELLDGLSRLPQVRGTPAARAMADAAADRFGALLPSHPEAVVGLVGVLAASGRANEAFAHLERLGAFVPTRLRAAAGLAIVRSSPVTEPQGNIVRGWIEQCLADEPASISLRLNKAEFLALRQELPQAIAEYEAVVAKEPRNVVALNNLAWLLAADPRSAERASELVARATREVGLTGDLLDTRARVRITLKLFGEAERDLSDAIRLEPTALRWFHLAVSRLGQSPAKTADAAAAFQEAKRRGLEPRGIHPADLSTFRVLEAGK